MKRFRKLLTTLLWAIVVPVSLLAQSVGETTKIDSLLTIKKPPLLSKGSMYLGASFNFAVNSTENQQRLTVFIQDRKNNNFSVNVDGGYFIKNNWALGGLISYGSRNRAGNEINSQGILQQVQTKNENWGIYATMKNYIPLDKNHRFFLYNLVMLGGKIGNSLSEITAGNVLTRTYTKDRALELKMVPGVMVNVIKGFSVEVGAELAGLRSSWSETKVNGVATTKTNSTSADLSINLLRLSLGFYYYFNLSIINYR